MIAGRYFAEQKQKNSLFQNYKFFYSTRTALKQQFCILKNSGSEPESESLQLILYKHCLQMNEHLLLQVLMLHGLCQDFLASTQRALSASN